MPKPLFQVAEQHQCQKAGGEVRLNTDIFADIDRSCAELMLHDPEAFLNLPTPVVDADDFFGRVVQIGCHGIKTVELLLLADSLIVQSVGRLAGNFTLICYGNTGNEALIIASYEPYYNSKFEI